MYRIWTLIILLKSLSRFSVLNCGKIHNFQPNSCEMGISALKQFGKRPRGQRTLVTDLAGVHATYWRPQLRISGGSMKTVVGMYIS